MPDVLGTPMEQTPPGAPATGGGCSMIDKRGRAGAFSRGARGGTPRKKKPEPKAPAVEHSYASHFFHSQVTGLCVDLAIGELNLSWLSFAWHTRIVSRSISFADADKRLSSSVGNGLSGCNSGKVGARDNFFRRTRDRPGAKAGFHQTASYRRDRERSHLCCIGPKALPSDVAAILCERGPRDARRACPA